MDEAERAAREERAREGDTGSEGKGAAERTGRALLIILAAALAGAVALVWLLMR